MYITSRQCVDAVKFSNIHPKECIFLTYLCVKMVIKLDVFCMHIDILIKISCINSIILPCLGYNLLFKKQTSCFIIITQSRAYKE